MESVHTGGATSAVPKKPKRRSFYRRLKALSPIPYLVKAHDYYVRSLNRWAARASYSGLAAGGLGSASPMTTLPRSFSTASSRNEDDYGELVRAASQRRSSRFSMSASGRQTFPIATTANSVGRIDDEWPVYFAETFTADSRYPSGRSATAAKNLHI